jgi:hypothetical protein
MSVAGGKAEDMYSQRVFRLLTLLGHQHDFLSPGRTLALHHGLASQDRHILTMPPVVFTCPATFMNVQHSLDDDPDVPENEYEVITCLACTKLHLINRKTGKILGQDGPRK